MKRFAWFLLLVSSTAVAQNENDVLQYTSYQLGGNARAMSLAGATGALGADISSLNNNPAGVGMFRRGDVMLSMAVISSSIRSSFLGSSNSAVSSNFNIPNVGFVSASQQTKAGKPAQKGLLYLNFGFSLSRGNNFYNQTYFSGSNTENSIVQSLGQQANGTPHNQMNFYTDYGLAWDVLLIDTVGNNPTQYSSIVDKTTNPFRLQQDWNSITKGRVNDYNFAIGANYSDKLFLGATVILSSSYYKSQTTFTETDDANTINSTADPELPSYKQVSLSSDLTTKGFGFGARFGAIYKPSDYVRMGVAYHTPRVMGMKDTYTRTIVADFDNGQQLTQTTGMLYSNYTIFTPGKTVLSLAGFVGKYGLVSLDYELVDYRNGRLSSDNYSFNEANSLVKQLYRQTYNLKVGAEYRYEHWYTRGGYALFQSPYRSAIISEKDARMTSITGGVGYRTDSWYMDFAVVNTFYHSYTTPYALNANYVTHSAFNNISRTQVMITAGLRF